VASFDRISEFKKKKNQFEHFKLFKNGLTHFYYTVKTTTNGSKIMTIKTKKSNGNEDDEEEKDIDALKYMHDNE
jgi:hypothetical protein